MAVPARVSSDEASAYRGRDATVGGAWFSDEEHGLATLPLFDANEAVLLDAWRRRDVTAIEKALAAGDALNRQSWQAAIDLFNRAKADIDLVRLDVMTAVARAEAALAPYAIDNDALTVHHSGELYGAMDQARLPPPDALQKLNYSYAMGRALSQAITGKGPWQLAAAAVVFTGVMAVVNHQRKLRHLKVMEGQIAQQAHTVSGDIQFVAQTLRTRLRPQFETLGSLRHRLHDTLTTLVAAELAEGVGSAVAARPAFDLACVFREAEYFLQLKAGN